MWYEEWWWSYKNGKTSMQQGIVGIGVGVLLLLLLLLGVMENWEMDG